MESSFCVFIIDYFELNEKEDSSLIEFLIQSKKSVLKKAQALNFPIFHLRHHSLLNPLSQEGKSFSSIQDLLFLMSDLSKDYENILLFHSNAPFLDIELTKNLISHHKKYLSDYTFYEYTPFGLFSAALNTNVLKKISSINSTHSLDPYTPFFFDSFIKKDLNQYDTEILLTKKDFRFIKEDFIIYNARTALMLKEMILQWKSALELESFLEENGGLLRGSPEFIEINLTNKRNDNPIFLPTDFFSPVTSQFFSLESLGSIVKEFRQKHLTPTIQFSIHDGEPLLYDELDGVWELIKENKEISFILETNGILLEPHLKTIITLNNLTTVIYLSSCTQEMYKKIHGEDFFETVEKNADFLLNHNLDQTYLQFVRMTLNEEEIKPFIDRWKAFDKHLLISQYNDFCGKMENLKVVDLAPLKRFACFKLAHELFINSNEEVVLCSQEISSPFIFNEKYTRDKSILGISNKIQSFYQIHLHGKDLPLLCQNCDIWYHFNF